MHTFHIPVMGIGFSIDTPVKVAHLGVSSVISLIDDMLLERMRTMFCQKLGMPYQEIHARTPDARALRITAYLNLINQMVQQKFNELKDAVRNASPGFEKYFALLPDDSPLKRFYTSISETIASKPDQIKKLLNLMQPGSIDVNIMTKLDRPNQRKGETLPVAFNDAHAALRGFAQSDLNASVVLSAGLNPRLYSYFEQFEDFYPNANGLCKKRIVLKVSDFRSASIQSKLFAKKGLWISEFRVESGLNCGGHAFPTQGLLMGPILDAFRQNKSTLIEQNYSLYVQTLKAQNRNVPEQPPTTHISFQGGVGTHLEHRFLLNHYQLNSVGWGSPFMLVPEVINIDKQTLQMLCDATGEELFLSDISPLGIPFNSLRNNTKDIEKQLWIDQGTPGSTCPKKYGAIMAEGFCTASRSFQRNSIRALDQLNLEKSDYDDAHQKITNKACICVGLGTTALIVNDIIRKSDGHAVSVCPGPNLAFFHREATFEQMVHHIYGKTDLLDGVNRPNVFVNELNLYFNYLLAAVKGIAQIPTRSDADYLDSFRNNLLEGIRYYEELALNESILFDQQNLNLLTQIKQQLETLQVETVAENQA